MQDNPTVKETTTTQEKPLTETKETVTETKPLETHEDDHEDSAGDNLAKVVKQEKF